MEGTSFRLSKFEDGVIELSEVRSGAVYPLMYFSDLKSFQEFIINCIKFSKEYGGDVPDVFRKAFEEL